MFQLLKAFRIKRKGHATLQQAAAFLSKKQHLLSQEQKDHLSYLGKSLDTVLKENNLESLQKTIDKTANYIKQIEKKSLFDRFKEGGSAFLLAAVLAILIRSLWFEFYHIPSGSMRPSFKELDSLTVSNAQFGFHIPLTGKYLTFNPNLVERAKVVIFSGEGIDLPDTDTTYFYFFSGKKRYIKRLIGKPGDTLYFYGGKIYGLDKKGNPIEELLTDPYMQKLEHIPFLRFDGRLAQTSQGFLFKHFNIPIGKLLFRNFSGKGEIFYQGSWKQEKQVTFSDFFGIRNYGMAKLLSPQKAQELYPHLFEEAPDASLYLEIAHSPSLSHPSPSFDSQESRFGLLLTPQKTLLPLYEEQVEKIKKGLYTARFDVKAGIAKRYGDSFDLYTSQNPQFPSIPNGRYEYYFGKAYKVLFGGILQTLPNDSPLYPKTPEMVRKLFNTGIDFSSLYDESSKLKRLMPHRYVYFREGDLYLMGTRIYKKNHLNLQRFLQAEQKRAQESTTLDPYIPFIDYGSPIQNGKWNKELILKFGVKVPEKHYLVLGDNHAMSADSRYFGFVPESNLQGVPSFIFWPPGERFATSQQTPYPTFTVYRVVIWFLAVIGFILYIFLQRRRQTNYLKNLLKE